MHNTPLQNRIVFSIFIFIFILISISGLISPRQYNLLPATGILEATLILCSAFLISKPQKKVFFFLIVALLYLAITYSLMIFFNKSDTLDFAQAYKAFYYVIPIVFFLKKDIFSPQHAVNLTKALILVFLLKYSYSIIIDINPRMGSRPGIFEENNFELIFLIILTYGLREAFANKFLIWLTLLTFVVIISGSRSSLLALLIVYFSAYLTKLNTKTIFYLFLFSILSIATISIFIQRMSGGIESIDRFNFLMVFIDEIKNWNLMNFLFGTFPITPLSSYACSQLSFYQFLFSFSGSGECYSVILHSYLLRAIFDHGILGFLFLLYFFYKVFRIKGYSFKQAITFISILFASALSVSAMNSVYTALAVVILISTTFNSIPPRNTAPA